MASPGGDDGNQQQKEKMTIRHTGDDSDTLRIDIQTPQGQGEDTQPEWSVKGNVSGGHVQTGKENVIAVVNTSPSETQPYIYSPQTDEGISDTSLVEDRPPSLDPQKADKSTDTSLDGMHVWGYRMGVDDRLHFCYIEGRNFVQIGNRCTYIEVNINNDLLQNIRSQGCLKAEVANGESLVTFKWSSLEAKREYIRCGLEAKLLPKLLDSYNSLENKLLEFLLCNSDDQVKLKMVEVFLKEHEASLIEIVRGSLVFVVLVADVEAKDRLYSPDSLGRISKFLEDLLITKTIREMAGPHQVSFKVTPLNDWYRMQPHDKHIFWFNTGETRESSPAPTDASLRELIQSIVTQELRRGLSQIQNSLIDTVARAVSMEMQKSKISEREMLEKSEIRSTSADHITESTGSPLEHTSPSPGSSPLEHTRQSPGSSPLEHTSQSPGSSPLEHTSQSPGSSPLGPPIVKPKHPSLSSPTQGTGSSTLGLTGAGPGSSPLGLNLSQGQKHSPLSLPSLVPKSSSAWSSSIEQESSFQRHLSHDQMPGNSFTGRASRGLLMSSLSSQEPGSSSHERFPDSAPQLIKKKVPCQGPTTPRKKRSFASILFDQQDRKLLWPDPVMREAAMECFQLEEGKSYPLDGDLQHAVQCVTEIVDIQRLATLMLKSDRGISSAYGDSELSQAPGLNTVLCLNVSESMRDEPLNNLIKCVETLREEIEDNTDFSLEENVGVVLFGEDVKIQLVPTNDYQLLEDTIANLEAGGETSPMLEALLASILLLFQTNKVPEPNFAIGDNHCYQLYPRIILMSDGLTMEGGGQAECKNILSDKIVDAVCEYLPMLMKASSNRCSINCVQFGNKSIKCIPMMEKLSSETGGDVVDPSQIQWLSNYFRRQNVIGKVIDWHAENEEVSEEEIKKRIEEELKNCLIEDPREQEQVEREVFNYEISEGSDHACQAASAIGSHMEPDSQHPRHFLLKPGDKIIKGANWNDGQDPVDKGCEPGTVIIYDQKDRIVKVKWANGIEDYYREDEIELLEEAHQAKPSEMGVEEDDDLQIDCDLGSDNLSLRETDAATGQQSAHFYPENVVSGQVRDTSQKIVWQWKMKGDNWVMYSPEQIDDIEKAYTSRLNSCVISSPDKRNRYHLDFIQLRSINLNDKTCCEIRRSEMTYGEYAQRIDSLT